MSTLVLGGGLSGLSASYYLINKFPSKKVTVLEASNRVGGWIKSTKQTDGVIFEQGPRTVRPKGAAGANTLRLLEDLQLAGRVHPIHANHPAATNRMILANRELHLLPNNLKSLFKKQKPFSKPLIRLLMNDLVTPASARSDESIYDFVSRRFGKEIGDYLIAPMICGICAGDAKEISVKFLMESLFNKEQKHGSISKGIVASFFETHHEDTVPQSDLHRRSLDEKWSIYSLHGGLELLPLRLEETCRSRGVDFEMNASCTSLDFGEQITAKLNTGKTLVSDNIISSIPAKNLSSLLQEKHPDLASLLNKIRTVSLAVINLQYDKPLLNEQGFGFLVCPDENIPILGVIYDSCCFSYNDKTVLTVMMGGHWFYKYFSDSTTKDEFLSIALTQIKNILKIDAKPDNYQVNILKNAIPQYTVGHKENIESIHKYILDHKLKLLLCGCSYTGVGINDVIMSAKSVIDSID